MMRFGTFLLAVSLAWSQTPDPEQLFHDAVAAQRRGDDAQAIEKYRELLKQQPDVPEVRANLGAALAHLGRYDEAIEQYKLALVKDAGSTGLRLNLALAYYKKGDFATAAERFKPLEGKDPRVETLLADCYSHLGRFADAVSVLTPAAAAHPDDLAVDTLLGQALIRTGKLQEGLKLVERVAAESNTAEAHLLAGQTLIQLNEFERAQRHADAAMRLNPKLPGLETLEGQVLQYLGDRPGAKAALGKALEENPNDFDAQVTLGAILNSERDLAGAREHLDRAVALRPDSALARFELARVERSQGQLEAALKDFERVAHDNPGWLQPHIDLSALYYKLDRPGDGQRERAIVDELNAAAPSH